MVAEDVHGCVRSIVVGTQMKTEVAGTCSERGLECRTCQELVAHVLSSVIQRNGAMADHKPDEFQDANLDNSRKLVTKRLVNSSNIVSWWTHQKETEYVCSFSNKIKN